MSLDVLFATECMVISRRIKVDVWVWLRRTHSSLYHVLPLVLFSIAPPSVFQINQFHLKYVKSVKVPITQGKSKYKGKSLIKQLYCL